MKATINQQADLKVVAACSDLGDALKARHSKPHVILVDLGSLNQSGVRVVKSVIKEFPGVNVIGIGLIPSQLDVIEFVEAGASGFILKDATVGEFLATIQSVARGSKVLPPLLTGTLFSHVADRALKDRNGERTGVVRMTKREHEIIALIVEGLSNKGIAESLHIATFTVKSHVHNILEKLALHSRLQIAMYIHNEETSESVDTIN